MQFSRIFLLFTLFTLIFAAPQPKVTDLVEMDITIGGEQAGTITLGLFGGVVPRTVENFAQICNGHATAGTYVGTPFHRVIRDFMIQSGDNTNHNGTGGRSIYGAQFADENFKIPHFIGALSMANRGPNTNGSQFFITTVETPWLNGRHVVFGRVEKNMDLVNTISKLPTGAADSPVRPVIIAGCKATKIE